MLVTTNAQGKPISPGAIIRNAMLKEAGLDQDGKPIKKTRRKRPLKKVIHVNRQKIDQNRKQSICQPVITVKTSKSNHYGHEVEILGPSTVVHRPDKPLSCGAKVWIITSATVIVDGTRID